jgi:hypothetical protein
MIVDALRDALLTWPAEVVGGISDSARAEAKDELASGLDDLAALF